MAQSEHEEWVKDEKARKDAAKKHVKPTPKKPADDTKKPDDAPQGYDPVLF